MNDQSHNPTRDQRPLLGIEPDLIPALPGCYRFYDSAGRVLYVGKAKNLRNRLLYYQAGLAGAATHGRVAEMLTHATTFDWLVLPDEAAALVAEANLIASLQPRYNIKLRDETGEVTLAITASGRAMKWWKGPSDKVERYGPWTSAGALDSHLEALMDVWGIRTCNDSDFAQATKQKRMCLLGDMGRCCGPCVNRAGYDDALAQARGLLEGRSEATIAELERRIEQASKERNYEIAGRLWTVEKKLRESELVKPISALTGRVDVVATAGDELGATVVMLRLAEGVLLGVSTMDTRAEGGSDREDAVALALLALYRQHSAAPTMIIDQPISAQAHAALATLGVAAITTAKTSEAVATMKLARHNAHEALIRSRARARAGQEQLDLAVNVLAHELGLTRSPRHIECVDISHFAGTGTVAAFSRLQDGAAAKSRYRVFKLQEQNNDYAAMAEAVNARLSHIPRALSGEKTDPTLAVAPDLLVVDGGPGQLRAATEAMSALGVIIPVVALSKRIEEIWRPGETTPTLLDLENPALALLIHARNEAHDTAKKFQIRQRKLQDPLDGIAGLGPARRKRLLEAAGGLSGLARRPRERWQAETWLPDRVADAAWRRLNGTRHTGGDADEGAHPDLGQPAAP